MSYTKTKILFLITLIAQFSYASNFENRDYNIDKSNRYNTLYGTGYSVFGSGLSYGNDGRVSIWVSPTTSFGMAVKAPYFKASSSSRIESFDLSINSATGSGYHQLDIKTKQFGLATGISSQDWINNDNFSIGLGLEYFYREWDTDDSETLSKIYAQLIDGIGDRHTLYPSLEIHIMKIILATTFSIDADYFEHRLHYFDYRDIDIGIDVIHGLDSSDISVGIGVEKTFFSSFSMKAQAQYTYGERLTNNSVKSKQLKKQLLMVGTDFLIRPSLPGDREKMKKFFDGFKKAPIFYDLSLGVNVTIETVDKNTDFMIELKKLF